MCVVMSLTPINMHTLQEVAVDLDELYPESGYMLYSVGNPPAYFATMLKFIRASQERNDGVLCLPFSGSYCRMKHMIPGGAEKEEYVVDAATALSDHDINDYFRTLQEHGLVLDRALGDYRDSGKKSVFVESRRVGGEGLASFAYMLFRYADMQGCLPQLKEAVKFHDIKCTDLSDAVEITDPSGHCYAFETSSGTATDKQDLIDLLCVLDNDNLCPRLVPLRYVDKPRTKMPQPESDFSVENMIDLMWHFVERKQRTPAYTMIS